MHGIVPFEAAQMSPLPPEFALEITQKSSDNVRNVCFMWHADQDMNVVLPRMYRAASQMLILYGAHGEANKDLAKIHGDERSLAWYEDEMKAEATEWLHGQLHRMMRKSER